MKKQNKNSFNLSQKKDSITSLKTPGLVLLQAIIWQCKGQVAIHIVIYNPKLGQAKTTYLICIPTATKEPLVRDWKRSSRESKRNSIAGAHDAPGQGSGMGGKCNRPGTLFDMFKGEQG